MMASVSARYAWRSLFRHARRTVLSAAGIGVGSAMALLAAAWIRGAAEMQIRAIAESGGGHLRVVPRGWAETRDKTSRLADWQATMEVVRALPGVKQTAVRARANGLLAFGNRSAGVEVTGADPAAETAANRIVSRSRLDGRYLRPDDSGKTVIGLTLAQRLDVELEDELVVTLAGREDICSAMLHIVGIIDTGSRDLNAALCHTTWQDVERITGYRGPAEISILLDDYRAIDAARQALAATLRGRNDVITWREVNPALAANVEGDTAFTRALVGIIVLVVSLGIASAQLTAVLERRREFAVLSALGMKGRQLVGLVMIEAVVVGLSGAVVAFGLGGSAAYYLATEGVSLAAFTADEAYSVGEVLLDPTMYADFGVWLVWYALGISVVATVAASLYPAWLATRIDPAEALRL